MATGLSTENDKLFLADISQILNEGCHKVHTAVNSAMVETYWNIGRRIVEQEQQGKERANYGATEAFPKLQFLEKLPWI